MRRRHVLSLTGSALLCSLTGAPALGAAGDWPRRFTNADGTETAIPAAPQRILSTSVTLTGTLLAIGAPVVASAGALDGSFFAQWEDVAKDRDVETAWPAGSVDIETAYAMRPDLIVVSTGGADSALAQRAMLEAVAPVVVLDYGAQSWQELARALGRATGREAAAAETLKAFDAAITETRAAVTLPEGRANIVSYNGPGAPNPIATPDSPQAQLLAALGFGIESPSRDWQGPSRRGGDFVRAEYEHLTKLTAGTTFLLAAGEDRARAFRQDSRLANLPSVAAGRVYGLGPTSFRIDPYSARDVLARMRAIFGPADG